MKGILANVNIQGHVDLLVVRMQAEPWKLFWDYLHLQYFHFADVGLEPSALDSLVWETCQKEDLVLVTDNRNKNDLDSLEAAIQTRTTPTSLPVFTIANVPHLRTAATTPTASSTSCWIRYCASMPCEAAGGCICLEM